MSDAPDQPVQPDDTTRYDRGWEQLTRINGTDDPRVVNRVAELSPDLARMIVEFGYGDCYADRPMDVLSERERQLVTLGALAALGGCEDQLKVHAHVARRVGLSGEQVIEAVVHALPYVGFPRTLNALEAVRSAVTKP